MEKTVLIHLSDCFYPRVNGVTSAIDSIVYSLKDDFINILIAPDYSNYFDYSNYSKYLESKGNIFVENYKDYLTILRVPSFLFWFNKEDRFMNSSYPVIKDICDFIYKNFKENKWIFFNHNIFNSYVILSKILKYVYKNYSDIDYKWIKRLFYFHTFWEYYVHYVPVPAFISKVILKYLNKEVIRNSDLVFVANEYVKNYILFSYFGKNYKDLDKRIIILPLPLNYVFWEDFEMDIDKELKGKRYVMYAGRLAKEKNLFFLIDIFKQMDLMDGSLRFYICGDGPEKDNLRSYVLKNNLQDKVVFTGYISQELIRRYYKYSQAVLFVSKTETLGLVLLEAMAQKALVISLNVDPFKNIIKSNYNGILIDTEDPKLFAKKVLDTINNEELTKKIKENAFNFSLEYHPDSFKKKFINLISEF